MTPTAPPDDSPDTRAESRLLTPAELALMTLLWDDGPGTVRQVLERLPADRSPAYTTVSTILRILESKGFVHSHKQDRSHVYAAAIERDRYEQRNVRALVGSLFGGDAGALARRLVTDEQLSDDDLRDLQRLLDERLGQ
jgi:predicted transcriptional regulator